MQRLTLIAGLFFHSEFFENKRTPAETEKVKNLFIKNGLRITRHPRFKEEFARYPVIYLSLSVRQFHFDVRERLTVLDDRKDIGGKTQEDLEELFQDSVLTTAESLRSNGYLELSPKLNPSRLDYLRRLFARQLSKNEWKRALRLLTEFMFTLTGQNTIVLVDEYDTPMSEALAHGYLEQVTTPPRFKINSHIYLGQFLFQGNI